MSAQVKKWGNSASVRIPAAILDAVHLSIGQDVEIRAEDGRIIIEPVRNAMTLEALLAKITPDNLHKEIEFGNPAGDQIFRCEPRPPVRSRNVFPTPGTSSGWRSTRKPVTNKPDTGRLSC